MITYEDIAKRPFNGKSRSEVCEFNDKFRDWNIRAIRCQMDSGSTDYLINDLVEGKTTEQILDDARTYIEYDVYTREEWDKYFIPAINKKIEYNESFVRWFPGYLIRNKETGKMYIVKGDYNYLCDLARPCFKDLSVYNLDENGEIEFGWAWLPYESCELVDTEHIKENFEKIERYTKKFINEKWKA